MKQKNKTKKNVKIVFEKSKKSDSLKKEKKRVNKKKPLKTQTKQKKSDSSKKKDYIVISILAILIIGVIIIAFLVPQDKDVVDNDLDNIINNDIIDEDLGVAPEIDIESFEERIFELNVKIIKDITDYQKQFLRDYYDELNLNSQQMDACLAENDFLLDSPDVENFPKIKEIIADSILAEEIGIISTPTLYINGYSFSGYRTYDQLETIIDLLENSDSLTLDYSEKSFTYQSTDPKLYVIYDKEKEFTTNANIDFIEYLTTSDLLMDEVKNIFTEIFEMENIEHVQYNSLKGKEILQTLDAGLLPTYYLVGDLSSKNFYTNPELTDLFNIIFTQENINDGYYIDTLILKQLGSQIDTAGLFRLIDYKTMFEDSYVIGDASANINFVLFTDYDCPFCKSFEENTLNEKFFEEYIYSNKANIIIKPMITGDSIFPIVFFKCSQEQGVSLEVHKKIFDLNDLIGFEQSYNAISYKYIEEIEKLQKEYEKIMELFGNQMIEIQ